MKHWMMGVALAAAVGAHGASATEADAALGADLFLEAPALASPTAKTPFSAAPAPGGQTVFETSFTIPKPEEAPGIATLRRLEAAGLAKRERAAFRPFGDAPSAAGFSGRYTAPLNEFAGHRRRVDPGIFGAALGEAKATFLRNAARRAADDQGRRVAE